MERTVEDMSNIAQLAKRLEGEIHRRQLLPGDRFLTAVEAGHVLGVSRATADRAMGVLARNKLLLRRRSLGTFVGPQARDGQKTKVSTVYVLLPSLASVFNMELHAGLMIDGIRGHLPDANVQFSFFPLQNPLAYIREMLEPLHEAGTLGGVVAVSCPEEVYEYLSHTGVPTVVMGSLYQGGAQLSSIDSDNRQAGRLLMKHLLDRGHRRAALLITNDSRPGDHDFFDGISAVLSEAGLPHNALMVRVVPPRDGVVPLAVGSMLNSSDRPTGIIVRHPRLTEMIETEASARGLAVPDEFEIVTQSLFGEGYPEKKIDYTHVKSSIDEKSIAIWVGEMLGKQHEDGPMEHKKTVIPVELCVRKG